MNEKRCLLTLIVAVGMLGFSAASAEVVTLQQGLNGYAGCEDTFLSGKDATQREYNYGGGGGICTGGWLTAGDGDKRQALIRFNEMFGDGSNQIPAGAEIVSAELRLYAETALNNYNEYLRLYPMVGDWVEGNSSWAVETGASCGDFRKYSTTPSGDDYWGTDGTPQLGPKSGVDYLTSLYSDVFGPKTPNQWVVWDITEFVQNWQDGTMVNNGVYTHNPGNYLRANYYSSEYEGDTSLRPMLVVEYVPEPATMMLLCLGVITLRRRRCIG